MLAWRLEHENSFLKARTMAPQNEKRCECFAPVKCEAAPSLETCRDVCKGIWCNCYIDCLIASSDDGGSEFDEQRMSKCDESTNPDLLNQCEILCEDVPDVDPLESFGECDSTW